MSGDLTEPLDRAAVPSSWPASTEPKAVTGPAATEGQAAKGVHVSAVPWCLLT